MGCDRGRECEYCHEDHPKKPRRRGKKKRKGNRGAADADEDCSAAAEVPPEAWGVVPVDECDSDRVPEEIGGEGKSQTWSKNQDIDVSAAAHFDGPSCAAPTPDPLVPLLTALEFLAPLPSLAAMPIQEKVPHDGSADSWHQEEYHIPSSDSRVCYSDSHIPYSEKLSLWYHESTISLEVGNGKHIIPFLNCNTELQGRELEPLLFYVEPELPEGLHLDTVSGVIKGIPTRPTTASGYSRHTVVAANAVLTASTTISIYVRPAGFWTCGTNNIQPRTTSKYNSSPERNC